MKAASIYNDVYLFFDEGPHKYTDTLGNEYKSVTTLIGDYAPKFNEKYWLHKKSVELGISEATLKKQWDDIKNEACTRGTATHNGIEDAIKDVSKFKNAIQYLNQIHSGRVVSVADIPNFIAKPLDVEAFKEATNNKYPEIYRVFDYYTNKGFTIYSEIGAFLVDYLVSGTIDILCVREDCFAILDWKTNRDGLQFESGYYKKDKSTKPAQKTNEWVSKKEFMLPPVNHLPECNGSHYTLQLSLYAYMVECILNIPCFSLALCHIASPFVKNAWGMPLRDSNNQYPIYPNGEESCTWHRIAYRRNEAKAILNDRLIYLKSKNKSSNKQLSLF